MQLEYKIKYNISTDLGREVPEDDCERLNDVVMIELKELRKEKCLRK